ncbi:MAG: hypothetical protein RL381_875 [Actinomycetota bacterium]
MFFKRLVAFVAISIVALSIGGYFTKNTLPYVKETQVNSISGRPGVDGPVLAVKIDDTRSAHPQIGLEDADLVYIEQVEGGLTRLAAIFSSKIPQLIGPVRSARISDIELLSQYGRVGFAYSGAQRKLWPVIASANLENLGAQNHSSSIYTTDPQRIPPYAMVLRADLLMQYVAEKRLSLVHSKNMGWSFGDLPKGGKVLKSAHISWPASSYDAHWSAEENRWLLDHSYEPNISESGIRLGASTFVIQLVSITDSEYKDKVGGVTPFSATVGQGRGYILRNGRVFNARWERSSEDAGTTWRDASGEEIPFNPGQIWVALTDREPVFTFMGVDAGNDSSK